MAFELKDVVPWGRNLDEYINMFGLTDFDLNKRIISFGDGPASFNCEMTNLNRKVISLDPIYQFSKSEVLDGVMEFFQTDFKLSIHTVSYEFQKGGNQMLKIKHK